PRACFWTRSIRSFRGAADERTVYVRTSNRDVWALEFLAPCRNATWAHRAQVRSRTGGQVCEGRANAVDGHVPGSGSTQRQRCSVSNVRRLTPTEVTGLPPGARP